MIEYGHGIPETMALLVGSPPFHPMVFISWPKFFWRKWRLGMICWGYYPMFRLNALIRKYPSTICILTPRKLGKWWQMWYDDFGFYRFTTFMVCLKFRPICLSPEFSLASDQKLRWRLLTILPKKSHNWCVVGIVWKLHQETAINCPLYHQRVVEPSHMVGLLLGIPHGWWIRDKGLIKGVDVSVKRPRFRPSRTNQQIAL